jgi:uncharacterized damage-inducible protein DinB
MHLTNNMLERLVQQYESISNITEDMQGSDFHIRVFPGKWNVHEQIAHLASHQALFLKRINRILEEDQPSIPNYVADEDPDFENWLKKDTISLLNNISVSRKIIVKQIESLTQEQLYREGYHLKFGKMNIPAWIEFFLLHEAHHTYSIFRIVAAIRISKTVKQS